MLSKENQKELCNLYLKWQREYNETQDKKILWNHLRPLLVDMISNCAKKKCGNHFIEDFEWRVENQAERVIKRYIDNPQYNRSLPMTIAYWESINLLYGSGHEKLVGDYDNEWDYENASYEEDDNTKIIDAGNNRIFLDYDTNEFYFVRKGESPEAIIKVLCDNGWKLTNK